MRRAAVVERLAAPVIALLLVGLLAADDGGYFPTAWGWGALMTLLPLAVCLVVGVRSELKVLDAVLITLLTARTAWIAASIAWSDAPAQSVLEAERAVLIASGVVIVLLLARRADARLLIGALLLAIALVDVYSLSTRLFPNRLGVFDPIAGYRLGEPIGYWNGLAIFTAIGCLLAVGVAARYGHAAVRACAAAALVLLATTLYFTYSRGGWIALGIGIVFALLFDARRAQLAAWLLALSPLPAVAVLVASRSDALTRSGAPLADAVHEGHRLAVVVAVLAVAAALCALLIVQIEQRWTPPRTAELAFAAVVGLAVVAVSVGALVHYGGPVSAGHRLYDSFKAPPVQVTRSESLNRRLFNFSGNGRVDLWRVAWRDYAEHEALGSGAGTFARYWARDRPLPFDAKDAHSAYLETLAEQGPIGLALLAAVLAVPLLAAFRARRDPVVAVVLGAYLAFLVHAGIDWDFELPAVTLAGLLCGTVLVVAARGTVRLRRLAGYRPAAGFAISVLLVGFTLWGLLGNSALAASKRERSKGNFHRAEVEAARAEELMPWSPQPWVALGFAQAARGDRRAAALSFRRAIAKDPGEWTAWFDLAVVTRGQQRKEALRQALRLNPLSHDLRELSSQSG